MVAITAALTPDGVKKGSVSIFCSKCGKCVDACPNNAIHFGIKGVPAGTMKRIKIIVGISWAFACLIIIMALFPGLTRISGTLAELSFMKINSNYTGGEIA
jgi:ferredoxin